MKQLKLNPLLGIVLLLCLSVMARGAITINGPSGLCKGQIGTFSITPTSGVSYSWTTPGGTILGSTSSTTVNALWSSVGTGVIKVYAYNTYTSTVIDSGSKNVTISSLPQPNITTNYRVACVLPSQDSTNSGGGNTDPPPPPVVTDTTVLDDKDGCIKVCEGTVVKYYAVGNTSGGYTWSATGGTIVGATNDDSVLIEWTTPGIGSVTVYENSNGCIGSRTICINVIAKPTAAFAMLPDTTVAHGRYTICINSTIQFKDLSTANPASPIISWLWDFGDGVYSSQHNPPSHMYTTPGTYYPRLVVKNSCGCTDTAYIELVVDKLSGPDIKCPSVVCENDVTTYSTSSTCKPATFTWTVVGGTIVNNYGNSIDVKWDHVGASGFGYVSLYSTCGSLCPGTTTIKVPVIQQNPVVTGPSKICKNVRTEFSIPLWPATVYNWGVIGKPTAIIGTKHSNKAVVQLSSPGSYRLHVTWKNSLAICGGDTVIDIDVVDDATITGPVSTCTDPVNSIQYDINPPPASGPVWTLQKPDGTTATYTGNPYMAIFDIKGTYTLTADGDFCADPLTINADSVSYPITSLDGDTLVCPGKPYTYTAGTTMPNTRFDYSASGGTLTLGANNSATVIWNSFPATLSVRRVSTVSPFCEGQDTTITIYEDQVNPHVTGPDTVCSDTYNNFTCNYNSPNASYEWKIEPHTTGSVQQGTYDPDITFLANHFTTPTPSKIIVKVKSCDTTVFDTLDIVIIPHPIPVITSADTVCSGDTTALTATAGAADYSWDYGDGTYDPNIGNTTSHVWWNATGNYKTITVKVDASGTDNTLICPPSGQGIKTIVVRPGPVVSISTTDPLVYTSPATPNTTFHISVSGTPAYSYQWYEYYSGPISAPAGTSSTYTATSAGWYFVVVQDASGCYGISNMMHVQVVSPSSCSGVMSFTTSESCGTVTTSGTSSGGSNPYWDIDTDYGTITSGQNTNSATIQYNHVGTQIIGYRLYFASLNCTEEIYQIVDVPLLAAFQLDVTCGTGAYNYALQDVSQFMPFYNNTSSTPNYTTSTWEVRQNNSGGTIVASGSGSNFSLTSVTPGGTYWVKQTVTLYDPSTSLPVAGPCIITGTIVIPQWPTVSFSYAPDTTCEGLPVSFVSSVAPASTQVRSYLWDFGDFAYSALANTYRVYQNGGVNNPQPYYPFLTIVDDYGCSHSSAQQTVAIYENNVKGTVSGATQVCSGPVTLTYAPQSGSSTPTEYMWWPSTVFTTSSSHSVNVSGAYKVTVEDIHNCRYVTHTADVEIYSVPKVNIAGRLDYCVGETVELSANAGSGISHAWKRNGSYISGATYPDLQDAGLSAGTYSYELELVYTCPAGNCSTSVGPVTVQINNPPTPPTISGVSVVSCSPYNIQLTASHSGSGIFNWMGGTYGPVTNVFEGGVYRVWYSTGNGCVSYSDTTIPPSPESYFGWFPSGCYVLCEQQMPVKLYGPPGVFKYWDWIDMVGMSSINNGTNTAISPLTLTASGTYAMGLGNDFCDDTTDPMDLSVVPCDCLPAIGPYMLNCIDSIPGAYSLQLDIDNPSGGTRDYTIGIKNGGVIPFKATLGPGTTTLNLVVTVMPPPPFVIEVSWNSGSDGHCYDSVLVDTNLFTYPCPNWDQQKPGRNNSTASGSNQQRDNLADKPATGMMVYPNPASHQLNVNYHYAAVQPATGAKLRKISVFDISGRRTTSALVNGASGTQSFDVSEWTPGVYLIRMEEDGRTIHTQRFTITH